jgi:hypothetical protein
MKLGYSPTLQHATMRNIVVYENIVKIVYELGNSLF